MKVPMIAFGFGRAVFSRAALAGPLGLGRVLRTPRLDRDTWAAALGAVLFGPLLAQILLTILTFLGMAVALIADPMLSEQEFAAFARAFQPVYLGAIAAVATWVVLRTLRHVYPRASLPPVLLAYAVGYAGLALLASALFDNELLITGALGAVLGGLAAGLAPMAKAD